MTASFTASLRGALAATALLAGVAGAQAQFKPAIVYDLGGKFDKSFNEGVYNLSLIHI